MKEHIFPFFHSSIWKYWAGSARPQSITIANFAIPSALSALNPWILRMHNCRDDVRSAALTREWRKIEIELAFVVFEEQKDTTQPWQQPIQQQWQVTNWTTMKLITIYHWRAKFFHIERNRWRHTNLTPHISALQTKHLQRATQKVNLKD